MFQSRTDIVACLLLFLLSVFIFTRGLHIHGLEYRDDEIFYYKSTQEMLHTGNILSPTYFGEHRFQKPILYYWLVLLSYKIFGVHWFSARLVAAVFAGSSVCLTWLMARSLFSRKIATLSAVILTATPLFFRHAKNAVPDMALNFFIVFAIYCAICIIQNLNVSEAQSRSALYRILFFVACALGFMVKGFMAIVVPFAAVIFYCLIFRKQEALSAFRFGRGMIIMLGIIMPWFTYMLMAHGQAYLNYMLVDETKNRIVVEGGRNTFMAFLANFTDHSVFYLNALGTYFAPWSFFLIGALPLALIKIKTNAPVKHGCGLMLIWFLIVFCFFSMIYFTISHYMLILSTPFAILVSVFLLEPFDQCRYTGAIIAFVRKYVILLIVTVGACALSFLYVFLAGAPQGWLGVFAIVFGLLVLWIHKSRRPLIAPLCLGLLMLFSFAQSSLLEKAGITSHAVLQKFAATIHRDTADEQMVNTVVGVGSHDIHEKEFQVYFDQRVAKAAGSMEEETRAKLQQLFSTDKQVYCLMTKKDFEIIVRNSYPSIKIIQEDFVMRRHMNIDKGFFAALGRLDQEAVMDYLKEKIVLVKKGHDA